MVTGFIFTERRVNKFVIKKLASEMTNTQPHSTMVYCGPPMPICKKFICLFRTICAFQLIFEGLDTFRSLSVYGEVIPFPYCFSKERPREDFLTYKRYKKRVVSS